MAPIRVCLTGGTIGAKVSVSQSCPNAPALLPGAVVRCAILQTAMNGVRAVEHCHSAPVAKGETHGVTLGRQSL